MYDLQLELDFKIQNLMLVDISKIY